MAGGTPSWHPDFAPEDADPLAPTPGFSSVPEALAEVAAGRFVVVLDDEDRENEGDLIIAADRMTPEAMAFMVRWTSGVVCVAMEDGRADDLDLPLMVPPAANEEYMGTAFTVTCDLTSVTTGISAAERARTVRALADPATSPEMLTRPGHIFPLRARPGGVLKRCGHTEAAVDLSRMAGCAPVGALCEIVKDDGTGEMARLPDLQAFAKEHGLCTVLISDMVRYRRATEQIVERTAVARLPTRHGDFAAYSFRGALDGIEHVALVKGDIGDGQNVLVRVHSECLTGDIFGSARCDCGNQLDMAMQKIAKEGRGVVVYLRGHEGRGIGLGHKLRAYNLQDAGRDTVEANEDLGLPVDSREYGVGAQILQDIGVRSMALMTNNPAKYNGLRGYGLTVVKRVPLITPINPHSRRYIETKRSKMGHLFEDTEAAAAWDALPVEPVAATDEEVPPVTA